MLNMTLIGDRRTTELFARKRFAREATRIKTRQNAANSHSTRPERR